ncbi:MAG: PSD1 and planctomycete cytochrome C domain-containing protein [Planctomycetota bacterium]|nr:PSD1 and planctomycete cytochrome C domain-containing protein [Planctomycetota bacterium]
MMRMFFFLSRLRIYFFSAGFLAGALSLAVEVPAAERVDFVRAIQPLLSTHSYACHPETQVEGGIRWDQKSALMGGDSGEVTVVPGKPTEGTLLAYVRGEGDERMPPEGEGEPLSDDEILLLERWIAQGAEWPDDAQAEQKITHWSLIAPEKKSLPTIEDEAWAKNPIDHFVLARLEAEGLRPQRPADRYTMARRVYLDLIGLPPTPEQVDAFVSDTDPGAYERLVDQLLSSPEYGERWARMWLDLARYADTQGYEKDARRTIYSFRDWVIKAFNGDMPFDRFTIEQLAGDMLPNPTTDQLVATAFHRNTMTNTEGGTDDEEFRTAAIVDRVNTTGQVWLGLTVGCAQCHTHKYDPLTQREYYQLYAFLNQSEDSDKPSETPTMEVLPPDSREPLETRMRELADLKEQLQQETPELLAAEQMWASQLAEQGPPKAPEYGTWQAIGPFEVSDFNAAFATVFPPEVEVDLDAEYEDGKLKWSARPDYNDGRVHPLTGDYVATYLYRTIEAEEAGPVELYFGSDDGIKVWLNGQSIHENKIGRSALPDQDRVRATLRTGTNHLLMKIANGGGKSGFYFRARLGELPESLLAAARAPAEERTKEQQEQITSYFRTITPLLKPLHDEIFRVETEIRKIRDLARAPTVPIMRELPPYQRRTTNVMIRGSFLDKGPVVEAGVPASLHPLPEDAPVNRMGLAHWIMDTSNPLTARVTVNRFWEKIFGRGLVETSEDFGTQGQPPTHPELLDYLALRFTENGWSMKELLREIVTSATYRQSSQIDEERLARDPDNILFCRGPRFRLEAEMVRDAALATSGLLSGKMYGKSVMPPQPEGVWQVVYSADKWETSEGEDRYRRGLYTFWRRTSPYPAMMAFDATSREVCTVRRIRTNTPLAALVTLNDPAFVEAAQALARDTVNSKAEDLQDRIAYLFRRCLVRPPRDDEMASIQNLYQAAMDHYRNHPEAASEMAGLSDGANTDAAVLASWTVIGNMLLNLDETLTKG